MPRSFRFVLIGACWLVSAARAAEITAVSPRLVLATMPVGGVPVPGTLITVEGRSLDSSMGIALTDDGGKTQTDILSKTFDDRAGTFSGRVPEVAPGLYDVVLTGLRGVTLDTLARALKVDLPVKITGVEPGQVSRLGGTPVIVRGENFDASTTIRFGRHPIANIQVNGAGTEASGIAPALEETEPNGPYSVAALDTRGTAQLVDGVTFGDPIDPQLPFLAKLRGESGKPARFEFSRGLLRHVRGRFPVQGANAPERAKGFLAQHAELFGLTGEYGELKIRRVSPVDDGLEFVHFRQVYRGLRVRGGGMVVALRGGDVVFTVGEIVPCVKTLPKRATVPHSRAETAAREAIGAAGALIIAPTQLEIVDGPRLGAGPLSDAILVWRVSLGAAEPVRVYVDATSGVALRTESLVYESGTSFHGFDYDLYDAENEATAEWTSCFELASNPHAADENGFDNGYGSVLEATVAHKSIRETYRYYHDRMNRHSYDNESAYFEVYFNSTAPNAKWVPWPCNLFEMKNGFADQEVITHEFTHGIIFDESDLDYSEESGALNEHYADVMAVILDRLLDQEAGNAPDWTLAENRTSGAGVLRNMNGPPRNHYNLLDITQGCSGTYDNGGVHCNSGIPNQAAYLMVEAGSVQGNVTQGGLALLKLMRLKYAAIRYLWDDAQMIDARNFEVGMAEDYVDSGLYGFTQLDACRVKSAWAVVGLGAGDFDCDGDEEFTNPDSDGDLVPDSRDNCVSKPNPSQKDLDDDGLGDACDEDIDGDGWGNWEDGCSTRDCLTQWAGCDDYDGDGVKDSSDNCPEVSNSLQQDEDQDGIGNVCEPDSDGDGVDEDHDNCPIVANANQANSDEDFFGDACDNCPDVTDPIAAYTTWGAPFQPDSDEDGIPDACDNSYGIGGRTGWIKGALSDGVAQEIRIEGLASKISTLPLEICPGGDCPEWYEPKFRLRLQLDGIGDASFWIADGEGRTVARSPKGSLPSAGLAFRPLGGESYTLNVYFKKAFQGNALTVGAQLIGFTEVPAGTEFRRADSNGDGNADISDAVGTFGFLFLGSAAPLCMDAADSNDDGHVDITDGIFTLTNLFLGGVVIPLPGKDVCGPDPTTSVGCDAYNNC